MPPRKLFVWNGWHKGDVILSRPVVLRIIQQHDVDITWGCFSNHVYLIQDLPVSIIVHPDEDIIPRDLSHLCPANQLSVGLWFGIYQDLGGILWEHGVETYNRQIAAKGLPLQISVRDVPMADLPFVQVPVCDRSVYVDNGSVRSSQSDFEFDVRRLAEMFPELNFYCTATPNCDFRNVFDCAALDLIALSSLSNKCDAIVGKGSGAMTCTLTTPNRYKPRAVMRFTTAVGKRYWEFPGSRLQYLDTHDQLVEFLRDVRAQLTAAPSASGQNTFTPADHGSACERPVFARIHEGRRRVVFIAGSLGNGAASNEAAAEAVIKSLERSARAASEVVLIDRQPANNGEELDRLFMEYCRNRQPEFVIVLNHGESGRSMQLTTFDRVRRSGIPIIFIWDGLTELDLHHRAEATWRVSTLQVAMGTGDGILRRARKFLSVSPPMFSPENDRLVWDRIFENCLRSRVAETNPLTILNFTLRAIEAFLANQSDPIAVSQLARARYMVASCWCQLRADAVEWAYRGDLGRTYLSLLELRSANIPLSPEELALRGQIEVALQETSDSLRHLLASVLYSSPRRLACVPELSDFPI
jgi:hypothetical protein